MLLLLKGSDWRSTLSTVLAVVLPAAAGAVADAAAFRWVQEPDLRPLPLLALFPLCPLLLQVFPWCGTVSNGSTTYQKLKRISP